jgi:predicted RecA/RadA family phage recombinase
MQNQVQVGDSVEVVAPSGGFTAGKPYLIGAGLFGVAANTVAAGAMGVLWLKGVYNLPKISAQAWTVGDLIYWSPNNNACSNVNSSSDQLIGKAWPAQPGSSLTLVAAANPSSMANVRLTPG